MKRQSLLYPRKNDLTLFYGARYYTMWENKKILDFRILDWWSLPFDRKENLFNIFTGTTVPDDLTVDLLTPETTGIKNMQESLKTKQQKMRLAFDKFILSLSKIQV